MRTHGNITIDDYHFGDSWVKNESSTIDNKQELRLEKNK